MIKKLEELSDIESESACVKASKPFCTYNVG